MAMPHGPMTAPITRTPLGIMPTLSMTAQSQQRHRVHHRPATRAGSSRRPSFCLTCTTSNTEACSNQSFPFSTVLSIHHLCIAQGSFDTYPPETEFLFALSPASKGKKQGKCLGRMSHVHKNLCTPTWVMS